MKLIPFSELVEINPRVKLIKAHNYPFVEMGVVQPGKKLVEAGEVRAYKGGGSKFLSGDTLFARITPCLENGKISQFNGHKGDVGFGSTEFFVFRARPRISDPDYVYYLSTSDYLRKPAERSMSGASGRQRADLNAIVNIEVPAPSFSTQRKIASILSAYDDLIENNLRRIKILEEMAQNLYREWFVKFRFPGHENTRFVDSELGRIPEWWEIFQLADICHITMGQSPKSEYYNSKGLGLPFHQGVTDFSNRFPTERLFCTIDKRIANKGDILFSVRAPVGRINIANAKIIIGRGLSAIRHKEGFQHFTFRLLKEKFQEEDTMGGGSIFNSVTKRDMETIKILTPVRSLVIEFENLIEPIEYLINTLIVQNQNLRQSRDLLLPKLISGEVDVSELDIENLQETPS